MKFFKRFVIGDPLWKACNKHNLDIVFNILENIQGIGCTINKDPTGVGWSIAVDGNTDIPLPPNANPFQVPFDADYVGGIFSSLQRTKYKGQLYHFDSATDESLDDKGKVYLVLREKTSYGAQIIYSDITRYIIVPDEKSLAYVGDSSVGNLPVDGAHTIEINGWSEKADLASKPENGALVMRSQQGGDVEYLPIELIDGSTQLDDKSLAYITDAEENKKAEIKGFATEASSTNLDLGGDIVMRKEDKSGIHFINHTAFAPRADGISLTTSGSGDEYTTQISGFDMGAEQATTPHRDGAKFLLRVPSGDSANVDYCPMEKYAVGADGKSLQMDSTDVADANGTTPPTGQTCHELAINGWNTRRSLTEKPSSGSVLIRPDFGQKAQYLPLDLLGVETIPDGTYKFVTDISWTGQTLTKTVDTWVVVDGVVTISHGTPQTVFAATTELA